MSEVKVNKKHKDRLFRMLFGDECHKENLLSLYNAVNNTKYDNIQDLEITTMEDCIYIRMKNDVSVLFEHVLSLYEHQSSYNPNMPLRGLMYFGHLYDKYIESNDLYIYGKKLIKIPTPQYIVFYNGDDMEEDEIKLRLSDAFEDTSVANEFEWTATVKNINIGRNQELMEKCSTLREYAILIDRIKKYIKIYKDLKTAIDKAIDECIKEGILRDFLEKHRAEVYDVCLTEYDEERAAKALLAEGVEIGLEQGRSEGLEQGRSEGLEQGRSEGLEQGRTEMLEKINILNQKLIMDKRNDDLLRSFKDKEFQKKLLEEYNIY